MHNHARWLVDHNQVVILKQNLERNIFRQHMAFHDIGYANDDIIALLHARLLIGHHRAIHLNCTLSYHAR